MARNIAAYQVIKNHILDAINTGKWKSGHLIPAEITLAEQFNVSRMTVNRALKELSEENFIERKQGSGTYVKHTTFTYSFVELRNISESIQQNGQEYHANIFVSEFVEFESLPTTLQCHFNTNQNIFHVQIQHCADGFPVQLEKRWVDTQLIKDFNQLEFGSEHIVDYLASYYPFASIHYSLQAKIPTSSIATCLLMKQETSPSFVITRRAYNESNQLFSYVELWHDGDKYCINGTL